MSHQQVFPRASTGGDTTIDRILADIPFFSVALLAFGVFTVFVVIKRVNVASVHLSLSAFLGFMAAILDLSRILFSVPSDKDAYTGLGTASQVGFALSVGFRYLFFWIFVAGRPRGELPQQRSPIARGNKLFGMSGGGGCHSGSWDRWGFVGFILKWTTLALVLVIPLLQILWRSVNTFHHQGPLYLVEAAVEIMVSAIFILKLILNLCIIEANSRSKALLYYTAPLLALLINLGLGVGNAVQFALSEASLGRLLQATELYILFVFILIMSFYKDFIPRSHSVARTRRTRVPTFHGIPEKPRESAFHISPPLVLTPEPASPSETRRFEEDSHASGLPTWVTNRFSRRQLSWDERQLWNQGDAETGDGPSSTFPPTHGGESLDIGPRVEELKGEMIMPSHTTDEGPSPEPRPSLHQTTLGVEESKEVKPMVSSVPETRRPDTFNISSYYDSSLDRELPAPPPPVMPFTRKAESPVYGLNGIIERQIAMPTVRPTSSVSSFDELLRQQQELDNSITALRLFSADNGLTEAKLSDILPLNDSSTDQSVSSFTKTLRKHESGSGRSEFSLSIFPEPPEASPSPPSPSSLGPLRARQKQLRIRKDDEPTLPVIHVHNVKSEAFARGQRLDSAGTQYDVTSFIDDLTVPESGGLTGLTSAFRSVIIEPAGSSDVELDDSPTDTIRDVHAYTRPIISNSAGLYSGLSLDPATASSGLQPWRMSHSSSWTEALNVNKRAVTFEDHNPRLRKPGSIPTRPRMTNSLRSPLSGVSEDVERPRLPLLLIPDKTTNFQKGF